MAHRNGVFTALGYCVKPHPPYRRVIVVGQDGESSLSGEASCCGDMSKLQVAVSSHGGNSAWCDQVVRRCGRSQWMINVASQRRSPHGVGQHCGPGRHARVLRRGVKSAWRVQVSSHRRKPLWHLAETRQRVVPPPPPVASHRGEPPWRAIVGRSAACVKMTHRRGRSGRSVSVAIQSGDSHCQGLVAIQGDAHTWQVQVARQGDTAQGSVSRATHRDKTRRHAALPCQGRVSA